jgi:hypothetical protein
MLTPCPECSHAIWSEVRSFGTFRTAVYFDDEEHSDTYATAVWRCPGCGRGLRDHIVLVAPERVSLTRRSRTVPSSRSGLDVPEE